MIVFRSSALNRALAGSKESSSFAMEYLLDEKALCLFYYSSFITFGSSTAASFTTLSFGAFTILSKAFVLSLLYSLICIPESGAINNSLQPRASQLYVVWIDQFDGFNSLDRILKFRFWRGQYLTRLLLFLNRSTLEMNSFWLSSFIFFDRQLLIIPLYLQTLH